MVEQISFSQEDIAFTSLQEFQIEECCVAVNEWYTTQPENNLVYDYTKAPRITKEEMKNEISKGTVFILIHLRVTKELVGCIGIRKPEYDNILKSILFLQTIKTEYRMRGLSTLLLHEAIRTAKNMGANRVGLNVIEGLKFQQEFVLKRGFKLVEMTTMHKSELEASESTCVRDTLTMHRYEKSI